jgi:hypothetical protein
MAAAATLPISSTAPRSGWIVSSTYDIVFFIGSLVVPLMLWGAFAFGWMTGVAVYVAFQLAFNLPHNFQTWTISLLDAGDRAKHGRRYLISALILTAVLAVPMVLSPTGAWPWVRDALLYWGYYHLVRQHYGLLRLYERRMAILGAPASPRESKLYGYFLDVVSFVPFILRFQHPEQMTINVSDRHFEILHPPVPTWLSPILWTIYLGSIAAAVVHHVVATSGGRTGLAPRALLLTSVTFAFGLANLAIHDIVVAVAVVTAYHNLQYLGLVFFMNRNRAELADREGIARGTNAPIDWLRTRKLPLYLSATFGYGMVMITPIFMFPGRIWAQFPMTFVVALHYYIDSRIWKFNVYPAHARFLRLKP